MRKTVPDAETLEEISPVIADSITVSRMILSAALLALQPSSLTFAVIYLVCGVTDVLDGFLAKKLHTESERGARLDSTADLLFAAVYAIKILPCLSLPLWIWLWIAVIAVGKGYCIIKNSTREKKLTVAHSFANRLTGLLLFLLPLTVKMIPIKYSAAFVCLPATFSVIKEQPASEKKFDRTTAAFGKETKNGKCRSH